MYHPLVILIFLALAGLSYASLQSRLRFYEYCFYHNYPVEKHMIGTKDGYTLEFYRIQKKNTTIQSLNTVVYLQHGLIDSSDTWIVNDEQLAPGFILANQGYDVWFGNSRGNDYSDQKINPKVKVFYNFSFVQMAQYDLPAAFEYIVNTTNQKIHYIGHSQGTLIMFLALAENNKIIEDNLASFSAFAPIAYVKNQNSPLARILLPLFKHQEKGFESRKEMVLAPSIHHLLTITCAQVQHVCKQTLYLISQTNNTNNNIKRMPVIVGHFPAGTSKKNTIHFDQYARKASLAKFDYGKKENLKHYGTAQPPVYKLSNIRVPVNLFCGQYDRLADQKDIQQLIKQLVNVPKINVHKYPYGHATFIWGKLRTHMDDAIKVIEEANKKIQIKNQ